MEKKMDDQIFIHYSDSNNHKFCNWYIIANIFAMWNLNFFEVLMESQNIIIGTIQMLWGLVL